jgi:hypothetical protein
MKIKSPLKGFTDTTQIGPVTLVFQDGVADYDEDEHGKLPDGIKRYLKDRGFGLGSKSAETPAAPPEPADPRKGQDEQIGTRIRDGAVNPVKADFLGPTNAGKANPHGSKVVNPEIHASEGVRPVKAGEVHVDDPAAQDKAEKAHAAAATDGTPVTLTDGEKADVIAAGGPGLTLGQSDPDVPDPVEPEPDEELKGEALDKALEERGLPKTGSADEKRARVAEHDAAAKGQG